MKYHLVKTSQGNLVTATVPPQKINNIHFLFFFFTFFVEDVAEVADQRFGFLRVKDNRRTSILIQQPAGDIVRGYSEFNQREFEDIQNLTNGNSPI